MSAGNGQFNVRLPPAVERDMRAEMTRRGLSGGGLVVALWRTYNDPRHLLKRLATMDSSQLPEELQPIHRRLVEDLATLATGTSKGDAS